MHRPGQVDGPRWYQHARPSQPGRAADMFETRRAMMSPASLVVTRLDPALAWNEVSKSLLMIETGCCLCFWGGRVFRPSARLRERVQGGGEWHNRWHNWCHNI